MSQVKEILLKGQNIGSQNKLQINIKKDYLQNKNQVTSLTCLDKHPIGQINRVYINQQQIYSQSGYFTKKGQQTIKIEDYIK